MQKSVNSLLSVSSRFIRLGAALTLLWWLLTDNAGWTFGALAIIAATLAAFFFAPPSLARFNLIGLLRFALYFSKGSLLGGIDVARRALHPQLPLQPAWLEYPLRLPVTGPARVVFAATITLLPGTLSADLQGNSVLIHTLSAGAETELARLEERIADLFSLPLAPKDIRYG